MDIHGQVQELATRASADVARVAASYWLETGGKEGGEVLDALCTSSRPILKDKLGQVTYQVIVSIRLEDPIRICVRANLGLSEVGSIDLKRAKGES